MIKRTKHVESLLMIRHDSDLHGTYEKMRADSYRFQVFLVLHVKFEQLAFKNRDAVL